MPPRPSDEIPVVFRFRPPRAAPFVDLRGEMTHFQHVCPMHDLGDGQFEKTVHLGAGVFQYKYFGGGDDWWLDPENPRTRGRDGGRNSVLVIGGAEEPVLHAPVRPFVFVTGDGRLCVRAALRKGHGETLSLLWDEGDGPRETPMWPVAEEDEHLLFEAHLPVSARAVDYLFTTSGGRLVGRAGGAAQPLRVVRSEAVPATPEWWKDAVVYTVLIDRFRRGQAPGWGPAPDSPLGRWGGDLDGVTAALPHLVDLGVTVIHLTPVALAPSAHRYDAVDPRAVDPAIGGEPALARLLEQAHARGLRVILDVAATHVDRDFFAFRDVRERGPRSPYWGWFHIHRYPFSEGVDHRAGALRPSDTPLENRDPGYEHYQKGQWREPLLRTAEPEVIEYLSGTFARWVTLGVDGFRVDAAADLPLETIRRIAESARSAPRPGAPSASRDEPRSRQPSSAGGDLVLFGEVIPPHIHRFTGDALDSATDFAVQEALYDWLSRRRIGASRVAALCARRRFDRGGPGFTALTFTATHDQHRFRSLTVDPRPARLAQLFVLTGAAVPMLLYGDEVGMTGGPATSREFEGVWPDRGPMSWPQDGQPLSPDWDAETLSLVKTALRLRRDNEALRRGDESFFPLPSGDSPTSDDVLVVRRTAGDEIIDILLHGGEGIRNVTLPVGAPSGAEVLLTLGEATLDTVSDTSPPEPPAGSVRLGPWSALVLRRVPSEQSLSLWRELSGTGALLSGLSFREGSVESAPLPVHLYVTVTERCNLSCAHCITSAPEKTTTGRARTFAPWLLDALREPFAAADYVGFVHGGESLVAPIFWDILRVIQTSRAARALPPAPPGAPPSPRPPRPDVHVLSNGMLLDEARVHKLLDHGVTSLSVSLDGATEITNDSLRRGGRLPTILENLRRAARIRTETKADLRMGVSTVVTSENVHELAALGEIVADLGLDWLKVEELYPCSPAARHQMIHAREPRVEQAMSDLRRVLARTGVVIVDHRDPPSGCACEAARNPLLAEFREADDFANRTVFHPCRMEWEQACIDPDGAVHPVDYGRPAIGTLLRSSLLDLWNGPEMRALRRAALARTPSRLRTRCPLAGG